MDTAADIRCVCARMCVQVSLVVAPGLGTLLCSKDGDCTVLFRTLPLLVAANAALIVYGLVEPDRAESTEPLSHQHLFNSRGP